MKLTLTQQKIGVLAIICLVFAISFAAILNYYPGLRIRSDFFVRWYAVDRLLQEGRNLYDPQNGAEVDQILYGHDNEELRLDFYYPAHLLIFLAPLGLLDYAPAHLIWTVAGQLFLLVGLGVMMWATRWPPTMNQATVYLLAILFAYPTSQHTLWGQFNTIGVLSLALTYAALRQQRYGLAGAMAAGLTFKPHPYLLLLGFLFWWVLFRPERWRFYGGFAAATAVFWFVGELFQPGWVLSFVQSLGRYVPLASVLDLFWNPHQVVAIALLSGVLFLFWRSRHTPFESPIFTACLVLSTAVWSLVLPMALMFHVLALSLTQIPLMAAYRTAVPTRYRLVVIIFVLLYLGGWFGFLIGLSNDRSIFWTQIVYKILLPLCQVLATLPLFFLRDQHTALPTV